MKEMIKHINIIDSLNDQICSILDLLQMTENSVDIKSIKTAAEMCLTMQDELYSETQKMYEEIKNILKNKED